MTIEQIYLGLGGNIGDSAAVVREAMALLQAEPAFLHIQCSSLYRTAAISPIPQRDYINAVCSLQTALSPFQLLALLQGVEKKLGKVSKHRDAPRPIDIDILLYGTHNIDEIDLQIPHPRWKERLFVLIPLAELTVSVDVPTATSSEKIILKTLIAKQLQTNPQRVEPQAV